MSKKDQILKNKEIDNYELNESEKLELGSLLALTEQAQMAQDVLYTSLVRRVAERYEISDKNISINMEEVIQQGAKVAKLVVS